MQSIANGSAKFSVRSSAGISPLRTDATRRTGLLLENRDRRSRAPPPPPAEGRTASFTASLYPKRNLPGARPEKLPTPMLRPTVFVRAPWRFILFRQKRNS